jgi:hypothetical protein
VLGVAEPLEDDRFGLISVEGGAVLQRAVILAAHDLQALGREPLELLDLAGVEGDPRSSFPSPLLF